MSYYFIHSILADVLHDVSCEYNPSADGWNRDAIRAIWLTISPAAAAAAAADTDHDRCAVSALGDWSEVPMGGDFRA